MFHNGYSTLMGDVVFSKNLEYIPKIQMHYHTPDLVTNGILKKRWKRTKHGRDILIKHMSQEFKQETMNEILVSKILENLNMIDFVKYYLYIEGYDLCCACENFIDENTEFVPAWQIYYASPIKESRKNLKKNEMVYQHILDSANDFEIPGVEEFLDRMIMIDKLTMNFDRHLGNFGYIRDVNTGQFIGPAPLFDFGNAFFPDDYYEKQGEMKFFQTREEFLMRNGKIHPLDISMVNSILEEYPFLSDQNKKELKIMLFNNNEEIKKAFDPDKWMGDNDINKGDKKISNTKCVDVNYSFI